MKFHLFLKTVLTIAISTVFAGCGGGGASSPNIVTHLPSDSAPHPIRSPIDVVAPQPQPPAAIIDLPISAVPEGLKRPEAVIPNPPLSKLQPEDRAPDPPPSVFVYDRDQYAVSERNTVGNKVKVGVMDTGVRVNDYLKHAVQKVFSYDEDKRTTKITTITDLTEENLDLQDISEIYHGTLVAEVIAAKPIEGSAAIAGLATDIAQLYAVRTTNPDGIGFVSTHMQAMSDLNEKYGVKLFNLSGGTPELNPEYKAIMNEYAAKLVNRNTLLVLAAGNDGKQVPHGESLLPVTNPQLEKGFLVVTGLNLDGSDLHHDGQEGGSWCGDAARWCMATDYFYGPIYSDKQSRLIMFAGTSASAPKVTATAAMIWSKYPWLTADQIRQVLLTTSRYLDDGSGGNLLYNKKFGWGVLHIEDALKGPKRFSQIFAENFEADVTTNTAIFSNNINGDAGLTKTGMGTLVMAGASTYQGATTINAGKLQVTGGITSNVLVNKNGALSGRGTVGSVLNHGVVSTHDGRLTMNGDFKQTREGTLAYSLHHFLTVDGQATLDGALEVSAKDQAMVTKGVHDVLYAKGIDGVFATHTATSPFLQLKGMTKTSNKVSVEVDFADARSAGMVSGGISTASGELLNQLMRKANSQALAGEQTKLTDYIAQVQQTPNRRAAQALLNSNSGAFFAETPSILLRNDTLVNAQLTQRNHQVMRQDITGVWAVGSFLESTNKATGWDTVNSKMNVITAGADTKVFAQTIIGAYISNLSEKSKYTASMGTSQAKLTALGLYAQWKAETPFYIAAHLKYGFGDIQFKHTVTNAIQSESSTAKSDIDKYGLYTELGYGLNQNQMSISPYIALSHNRVLLDGLKESSAYGVSIGDLSAKENKGHAGIRFDYALSKHLLLGGYTEYAYAFDRNLPKVDLSSNLDRDITVVYNAPAFDKDYFLYGIGFNYLSDKSSWNIFGDLAGNAINSGDYQAQLGLKYRF